MKKITELDTFSGLGGGTRIMCEIVEGLSGRYEFSITAPAGYYLDRYKGMSLSVNELVSGFPVFEIRKSVKKDSPGILHVHGTRAAMMARLALLGLRRKPILVYTLHGLHITKKKFPTKQFLLFIEKFLNRWTDVLVCVSDSDKKEVLQYGLISESKIKVIKNGIDVQEFQVDETVVKALKSELGLDGKFIVSGVGRLHPQKDFSTPLKAIKVLAETKKDIVLLVIGDGPLRKDLEAEAKSLGIEGKVRFLGYRKDIPELLNLSDIMLLSTNWEGLALVPIEAGAAGKPIIASDVEGVSEVVVDGKTGCLFKKGSVDELVEKIDSLYKSAELRKKMGEAGNDYVKTCFSKEKMVEEYGKLFDSI